ncbi:helicase-related protein [Flavobacterium myungsuense]|uniref:helicase-related protein n=1 Tax=Flavobacterium myungsuense TaxID=651823 RepID=UPI0036304ED7
MGQSKEKSSRDKEIEYQKFREMIGVGLKNSIADIDVLGFDYAVIDEAHRCKNVFSSVKSDDDGNKRYNIQSATSETGQKAFLILSFIQRKYGRNTMLLTATPFSNSPLEIYSMLSLVAYDSLRDNGIVNLDTFFDLFVLPTVEWAANYKEEIVEKEVIKSFTNRRILQKLIYNHILYKTGEEAGVVRPKKINLPLLYSFENAKERLPQDKQVLTYINMTPKQRENQNGIVAMAKSSTQGKLDMGNLFRALAYSLDNALSPYLLNGTPEDYKDFVEQSPKIAYVMDCIKSVKSWHEEHEETASGQVIYMNRGKMFFPLIKEYLEKEVGYQRGVMYDKVKVDEVEIISSEINDTRKETIKEAFLDGVVKIIIGTATIREGIDLQKRGTVIYNCYPEWNPTDIRQLEGRIWRQGNQFQYVRIVMPLVQDSMDVFVFQKLEEKTSRINDIWFRGDRETCSI